MNEEAVARLSMIAYFDLLFQILQSSQNNLRQSGDTGDPGAGSVVDGVQDGGVRGIQRSLAAAGSAVHKKASASAQYFFIRPPFAV